MEETFTFTQFAVFTVFAFIMGMIVGYGIKSNDYHKNKTNGKI